MNQLLGEYPCKIDPKGRLRLPSALLDQLPADDRENFVVNRGMERCLVLFPKKVWDIKTVQVNQLNEYDEKARVFKRVFYRGATPLRKDAADRLNFPNQLLEWAGIMEDGEVVLAAVHDKVEVWAAKEYEAQLEQDIDMSALAQEVLGNKIPN